MTQSKASTIQKHERGLDLSSSKLLKQYQRHKLPRNAPWDPEGIEINGREGRRAMCIFAKDRIHYRVFGLDSSTEKAVSSDGMAGL